MIFRQLFDCVSCTYTYLLGSPKNHQALLIDPVLENIEQYLKLLDELNLELKLVLDTHIHADHITAGGLLAKQTKCNYLVGDNAKVNGCASQQFHEGEVISLDDNIKLTVMYTPGHTDDSYSFVMQDRVFTGDALLIRGCGRTDFQNGDPVVQYKTLTEKLMQLPDDTLVYPAHDYKGMTVSTICEERQFNPRLQVANAAEFIELMNGLNLPHPKLIDIAVPANLNCGINE